jgi:hypothetical protein
MNTDFRPLVMFIGGLLTVWIFLSLYLNRHGPAEPENAGGAIVVPCD